MSCAEYHGIGKARRCQARCCWQSREYTTVALSNRMVWSAMMTYRVMQHGM